MPMSQTMPPGGYIYYSYDYEQALDRVFPRDKRACIVLPQPALETENLIRNTPQTKFIEAIGKLRDHIMTYD